MDAKKLEEGNFHSLGDVGLDLVFSLATFTETSFQNTI